MSCFAGDITILNNTAGLMNFKVSSDKKFEKSTVYSINVCRYYNPYSNIGGQCDGINKFQSNREGELFIKFHANKTDNSIRQYVLESHSCYQFIWIGLGYGFELEKTRC